MFGLNCAAAALASLRHGFRCRYPITACSFIALELVSKTFALRAGGFLVLMALAQVPGCAGRAWRRKLGVLILQIFSILSAAGVFIHHRLRACWLVHGLLLMSFVYAKGMGRVYVYTPELRCWC